MVASATSAWEWARGRSRGPKAEPVETPESIAAFLGAFRANQLTPLLLGQERPPHDRNASCAALTEVVTDSFGALVLDPAACVLLEGYSPTCDACKAFGPRLRMFACLVAKYGLDKPSKGGASLRVCCMDIFSNDRVIAHMPERYTPTLRLFPPAGAAKPKTNSVLLEWNSAEDRFDYIARSSTGDDDPLERLLLDPTLSLAALTDALAQREERYGLAKTKTTKIVLPTLPELVAFVQTASKGAVSFPPEAAAEAEALEQEAMALEQAYTQVLDYLELWQAYVEVCQAAEAASPAGQAQGGAEPKEDAVAMGLRKRIQAVYRYILTEAGSKPGLGQAEMALDMLDGVAEFVDKHGVIDLLRSAMQGGLSNQESSTKIE